MDGTVNFDSAKVSCASIGGTLPFFNDQADYDSYKATKQSRIEWLGIVRGSNDDWETTSGAEVAFFDWMSNQPDNLNDLESCVEIRNDWDNQWNDNRCTNKNHFSCRIDTEVPVDQECQPFECPISPTFSVPECSTIVDCDPIAPKKNTLVVSKTAVLHFRMSVDIYCNVGTSSGSTNIIHVTNGGFNGNIGNRVFAIWRRKDSSIMHININSPTTVEKRVYVDEPCNPGEWNTYAVELKPASAAGMVEYSVTKDGNVILNGSYDETGAYSSGGLKFYVSNPWTDSASSSLVKNFYYCVD